MEVGIAGNFLRWPQTGTGEYLRHLLEALGKQLGGAGSIGGVTVLDDTTGERSRTGRRVRRRRVRGQVPGSANVQKVWLEQVLLPLAARAARVDVLHYPYFAGPLAPTVPVVMTVHDLIPLLLPEYSPTPLARLYARLCALAARRAAVVLADSEHTRRDILATLRVGPDQVRVVPLAAAPELGPATSDEVRQARERYGLPDRFVLYLGGLDRRKNLETLLRAVAWLRDDGREPPPLVIAGGRPGRSTALFPDYEAEARELGLAELVHFTGPVPTADKAALYTAALAFAFPSRYEGFGLPPLEALACGTPVLCSNSSSLTEVVGDAALTFAPDDVDALASGYDQLARDAALRVELSRRGRKRADQFAWDRTATLTMAGYVAAADGIRTR
ncbi:MAG: glycosyltransferase family 4 protein [Chloroflexi bacterium]|nr:glycosyltransferase family 4 protein [Chloroflexota bacterium]